MLITVNGKKKEYPKDVLLLDVAKDFQEDYPHEILLAVVNGKLQELHQRVCGDSHVSFLTAADKPGMKTYQRSALLIMLKAFYDVVGVEKVSYIKVDFSLGDGLFIETRGEFELTEELVQTVKARMQSLVNGKLPIEKRNIHTDEAIELFHRHKMFDKERLFRYRRVSRVNIYSLEGFEDYYYGYMVHNTGYIRYFDLQCYQDGALLLLPSQEQPETIRPVPHRERIFQVLREAGQWSRKLKVPTVGYLNEQIAAGKINDLILVQEALMEKKLGDIAEQIAEMPEKKLIMIAGPSSSGKTTFSHRLSVQLRAKGFNPHPIAVDNYFVNRSKTPRDEKGDYNYECLEAMDVEQFNKDMTALLAGETVAMPTYNFITGEREYRGNTLTLGKEDILVIEGIHCLNEALSYSLPKENKFKIYISALTQLNIDGHNRIPTTDGRLIRRIVRDSRTRGASAQRTIQMWPSVRRGEEANIFPFQEEADVIFNSALVYELAVLKQYAEPALFSVPRDSAEYQEAKSLLKFLDYFLGISSEDIPKNSILREFIGGSCFKV